MTRVGTTLAWIGFALIGANGVLFTGALAAEEAAPTTAAVPSVPDAAEIEFFESKIRPLLVKRCFECHSDQGKGIKGGLRLDLRSGLLTGGDSGAAVIPGKPAESLLVDAINYSQDSAQMPPRGKLPQAEIDLLTDWVRRGVPYPENPTVKDSPKKHAGIDFESGRQFWSFQPVHEHPLPAVKQVGWGDRRIDAFVLHKLEAAGLAPNPPADRRMLLRRLSFDLIGLPPTPEEIAAFEADTAADAYDQQVDRLLASPHYGEKWGRFWLDLVRYCDVPEVWAIDKHAQAWLYRDWVVQAWNDDLPFDRFLEMQLAADLVPEARPTDIAALGFLGLSPNYWKELKLDPGVIKAVVAEEWEERIHTLSGAVLGLTVACARCHDHKQDPISQTDYYALAGVLASTKLVPRSILPEADAKVVAGAREQIQAWQKSRDELLAQKPEPSPEAKQQAEELAAKMAELERTTPHYGVPLAYAAEEASLHILPDGTDKTKLEYKPGEAQNVALQIRGNPSNPGPVVPRRFLTVLSSAEQTPFQQGSGRRELARAFVGEAAPLTARVIVNRIWQQHFGQGLVDTPSNFGTTGSPPSHAELLDDLAARFIANGWSLKGLHRELVLSATYRQSSAYDRAKDAIDPDNRLLWRGNRRRLDVEAWRDAMLEITGRLNRHVGGPDQNLDDPQNNRRTLYGTVKRRDLHAMLRLLDFPDPTTHNATRDLTTTPLQQLFVLNSPFMREQSMALVERVRREAPGDVDSQVRHLYRLLFARAPTDRQLEFARSFLATAGTDAALADELWKQYAQALLSSNEFAFVD
jgi:mono/diheme cytochrome c family protein